MMTQYQQHLAKIPKNFAEKEVLRSIRRYRLLQICGATAIGLLASIAVARGITFWIFVAGLSSLIVAMIFAFKHRVTASAYILLIAMSVMLFAFALTGAGLFDLAVLGYPCLLLFSAILGGVGLFLSLLLFVLCQCFLIAWLTLQGIIIPSVPSLSWTHLIFILVIFVVTGFTVYTLVQDIKRLMLSLHDENEKVEQSRSQIQHLAHHDTLTDLPNRLYGEKLFAKSLLACEEKQQKLALLFIDLDNFKPVNDALGHAAGDRLLIQLTQRLSQVLDPGQSLIRFGGDEFLVFVPYLNDRNALADLATGLIKQCSTVFEISNTQVVVSASIGITCAPDDGNDFKQLCRKADIAMYKAKQDGRNTFYFHDESLDRASDEKFKLLQLLRPAIRERQFELYYQPMIDLESEQITTLEALLRWPQADGTMISPEQFIPLAESGGLINELGSWVIRDACLYCAQQRLSGYTGLRIAVNLSVVQFKDCRLYNTVENALEEAGLAADALELELTESVLIDETDLIQRQLSALANIGVTIAIDDFGTGYSNLGYLRNFNASKLKIDRSFINSLCLSKDDESLVTAIINMASSLGLETVAEGIEDLKTLDKLKALGCNMGQGYYWSKPLPGNLLSELLGEQKQTVQNS